MIRQLPLLLFAVAIVVSPCAAQEDGQVYHIRNRLSDKALMPSRNGSLLVQRTLNPEAEAQRWRLVKEGEFFRIVNVKSERLLRAPIDAAAQIEVVDEDDKDDARAGRLWIIEKKQLNFTIQSRRTELFLAVMDMSEEENAKVIQQELSGQGQQGSQTWELIPVD